DQTASRRSQPSARTPVESRPPNTMASPSGIPVASAVANAIRPDGNAGGGVRGSTGNASGGDTATQFAPSQLHVSLSMPAPVSAAGSLSSLPPNTTGLRSTGS